MKKISIIVAVFNVQKYIDKCIKSILNQTLKDIELIIINDGSTDNSIDKINEIKDDRITIINKKNEGVSIARNLGLSIATGEYVIFVDSDDFIINRNDLENMYIQISNSKSEILSGNASLFYDDKNSYKDMNKNAYYNLNQTMTIDKFLLHSKVCDISPVWMYLYNREFLINNNIRFKENRCHEDELFVYQALTKAKKIDIYSNNFYAYRQRCNSRNNVVTTKNGEDIIQTSLDLEADFNLLENIEVRNFLFNRSFNIILENIYKYKIYNRKKEINKYLLKHTNNLKDRIRVIIYIIHPRLYCKVISLLI